MRFRGSAIVVTDVFPPVNAVGVYRALALSRNLIERGWRVTVVTARSPAGYGRDAGLLERTPAEVRVVRTASPHLANLIGRLRGRRRAGGEGGGAGESKSAAASAAGPRGWRRAKDWVSWWLHVPDGSVGWWAPAVWGAIRHGGRPDVVFSTAPAWTGHLVGAAVARLLGAPLVADFRDPWCGSAWRRVPYAAHRRVDAWMERRVVGRAERVTCAWDGIRRHLADRYPERADRFQTILNGFDAEEIDGAGTERVAAEGRCVLLHSGTLYGLRSPVPLLEGLKRLKAESPAEAARLLVALVGPTEYNGRPLAALAEASGVAELVRVVGPVPHAQALAYLKGAEVGVLFGQGAGGGGSVLAPVPAKAYEYVGAGKAVLAIDGGAEVCDVMRQGGCRLWCAAADDPAALAASLRQIAQAHERGELGPASAAARAAFTRTATGEKLGEVLVETAERWRRKQQDGRSA